MRTKKTMSFSLDAEAVEKLKHLHPYSSTLVSALIREFFEVCPVQEVWKILEMGKPMTVDERVERLRRFVREKLGLEKTGVR